MGESVFYAKGDRDTVLKRIDQVHTITMYCPVGDWGVQCLKNSFMVMIPGYCKNENTWENVPAIDVLKCFLFTKTFIGKDGNMNILSIVIASLKAFIRLKYITFVFTDNQSVMDTYNDILQHNRNDIKNNIYKVDVLEFNLSDLFSQGVMDHFNKVLVADEIISNNYLTRNFKIDFSFDEYISFMDMFLGNNGPYLHQYDDKICDYFRTFPDKIEAQKPNIRIITNYSEL